MPSLCFQSRPVYILSAVRTPVGSPFKGLKDYSAGQLGGEAIRGALERLRLDPGAVSEVIWGNAVSAGAGQNVGRQSALMGGLPASVPAHTVNNVCGAGALALIHGAQLITLGAAECVVAGGSESATKTPLLFSKAVETPFSERAPVDSLIFDGLWCAFCGEHMGQLADRLAARAGITRGEQDQYALESHHKAAAAEWDDEIIPVGKLSADERIRRRVRLENFAVLPPAFGERGTVTSGSASVPSDGAAALILGGTELARQGRFALMARLAGYCSLALEPAETFGAAVPAIEGALGACGLKIADIDLFEISEAFAAQAIYTRDALKIHPDRMNISGGDIALGHPLGAAGARIVVTLCHQLRRFNKRWGVAAICYGGGGGIAIVVENARFA